MRIVTTLLLTLALPAGLKAADDDIVPPNLPADQNANLLRFLKAHEKLAREKVPAVAALYQGRDPSAVRWEYLQLMISKKSERFEPGDRVVRLAFNAADAAPVPVIVDLTKGTAVPDAT